MKRGTLAFCVVMWMACSSLAWSQMGDPANGPTKIPNSMLDPGRNPAMLTLESAIHKPLPEQYIWTQSDSFSKDYLAENNWHKGNSQDLQPHYFRRSFNLSNIPDQATLYIVGPRQATIYINGNKVGSFQVNPDFPMDSKVYSYNVKSDLRPGENTIAIEAVRGPDHSNGGANWLTLQQAKGMVLAVMIVPAAHGVQAPPLVMSDMQWKATMMPVPVGWQNAGFNDSSWPAADDLSGIEGSINLFQWNTDAGMYAWPGYDGISPFLGHYSLYATKVSHVYEGVGSIRNAQSLKASSNGEELIVTLPKKTVTLYNSPQLMLDFGREVAGRLEFQSDSDHPAEVTVQYGESEAEAFLQPYLGIDPVYIPPHATVYGPKSAFRYAIVRFTGGRETRFHAIRLDGIAYPVHYSGSFESSSPLLNKMWAIGAYTAHLCMQDDIWDAPKRDRGRWMGDLDVSGRTIADVFGDHFLMQDTLNRLIGPVPVKRHVDGIPGYSAFWVIGEKEFYLHTGSMQQLESVHTRLVQLLEYMETDLNHQNLYSDNTKAWTFVDWSPQMWGYTPQSRMATQFEYYAAFKDGAWLLRQLHDQENATRMQEVADKLKVAAQQYLLDAQGSFGDRWQPNAYAVVSGVANTDQYAAIWRNSLSSVGDMQKNPDIITPYYNFYVINAMADMGHRQAALDWIRQYWGGMVDEGATSYWEGYDPRWYKGYLFHASLQADAMSGFTVSLAHGWSSGVTPWLMAQVLGIQPTAGGYSKVDIRPDLIDLKWAKGTEPTPYGLLGVSISDQNGYVTKITLPAHIETRVSVPIPSNSAKVFVNGKVERSTPTESGQRAIVTLSGEGIYTITSR